jgi:hypothetical protein
VSTNQETLQRLILDLKGDRSYERLARDCGFDMKSRALHRAATKPALSFPDPDTIRGLSRGLNVPVTRVVMACARSVGLNVSETDPTELVLQGAGELPQASKDLLISMSRQLQSAVLPSDTPKPGVSDNDTGAQV